MRVGRGLCRVLERVNEKPVTLFSGTYGASPSSPSPPLSSPHPPPLSSPPLPPLLPSPPIPSPPLPSQEHCCVLHSIIGWDCVVGEWARVEGYPNYPDPNDPFGELYPVGISLGQEWLVAALHLMQLVSSGVVLWCCKEAVAMLSLFWGCVVVLQRSCCYVKSLLGLCCGVAKKLLLC